MHLKGKIIAITGASRTGKSYLAERLSKALNATLIRETPFDEFPEEIVHSIETKSKPLTRILWFHNMVSKNAHEANLEKKEGNDVILDSFWLTNHMYTDDLLEGFEAKTFKERTDLDPDVFGWPDIIIFLKQSKEGVKRFAQMGGRMFEQTDEHFDTHVKPVQEKHESFFKTTPIPARVIELDRTHMDFEKQSDLDHILTLLQ